jgi:hypothetical protein
MKSGKSPALSSAAHPTLVCRSCGERGDNRVGCAIRAPTRLLVLAEIQPGAAVCSRSINNPRASLFLAPLVAAVRQSPLPQRRRGVGLHRSSATATVDRLTTLVQLSQQVLTGRARCPSRVRSAQVRELHAQAFERTIVLR